jgi:hypothetical protein
MPNQHPPPDPNKCLPNEFNEVLKSHILYKQMNRNFMAVEGAEYK